MIEKIKKTQEEWKNILTSEQYEVMREKGTEPAFSCAWEKHGNGMYHCAACDLPLFKSEAKFESGTGWPSYYHPINSDHIEEEDDYSFGVFRTAVNCARCGSHLGHVFDDPHSTEESSRVEASGSEPIRRRYCINSVCLKLKSDVE